MDKTEKILEEIATIKTKLDNLERRLFGNGEEGIVERVRKLERQVTENKAIGKYKIYVVQLILWFVSMVFGAGVVWHFMK